MRTGCKKIVWKLRKRKCWGAVHTPERRVLGWVHHEPRKLLVKEYKKLLRNELLIRQKKTREWHISLNPRKKKEIDNYLQQ